MPSLAASPSTSLAASPEVGCKNTPSFAASQSTYFMDVPQETPVDKPIKSDSRPIIIAKVADKVQWDQQLKRETPSQFELRVYLAAIIPDIVHEAVNNSMRMHHEAIMASLTKKGPQTIARKSSTCSTRSNKIQFDDEQVSPQISKIDSVFDQATLKRIGSDLYSSRRSLAAFVQKQKQRASEKQRASDMEEKNSMVAVAGPVFGIIAAMAGSVLSFFSLVAICASSILLGIEADASVGEKDSVEWTKGWMVALNIYFVSEVTVKMLWFGTKFFTDKEERNWNIVDLFLGIQSFVDLFFTQFGASAQALRLMRLVRLLRSLRLLRWAHQLREFRKMVYSVVFSGQTLLCVCVVLVFVIYCFAAFFATTVQSMGEAQDLDADVHKYFGTISSAMFSLWLSITAGINWVYIFNPLYALDPRLAVVFVAYIALTVLGVLNIVTSVFVESAMASTKHFRDLLQQETSRVRGLYAKHLRDIFKSIDSDSSGMISMVELKTFLADPSLDLSQYMEALELNADDAKALFKLLDRDNSGLIDVEEFCDGCLRLKGDAKSFDINCLIYEGKRTQAKLDQILICFDHFLRVQAETPIVEDWGSCQITARHDGDSSEHVNRRGFRSVFALPKHSDERKESA